MHAAGTCVFDDKAREEAKTSEPFFSEIRQEFCIQTDRAAFCSSFAPRSRSILTIWKISFFFPSFTGSSVCRGKFCCVGLRGSF